VEEFVRTEAGEYKLPVEFKFHLFRETIGAIEVVQRFSNADARFGCDTPSWDRLEEQMYQGTRPGEPIPPPSCAEEMLACARTLGVACGTYLRADFYATDRGPVFGEFSSRPVFGGHPFTPFVERYFEELWQRTFPDQA
jgi:hypothetical protein